MRGIVVIQGALTVEESSNLRDQHRHLYESLWVRLILRTKLLGWEHTRNDLWLEHLYITEWRFINVRSKNTITQIHDSKNDNYTNTVYQSTTNRPTSTKFQSVIALEFTQRRFYMLFGSRRDVGLMLPLPHTGCNTNQTLGPNEVRITINLLSIQNSAGVHWKSKYENKN